MNLISGFWVPTRNEVLTETKDLRVPELKNLRIPEKSQEEVKTWKPVWKPLTPT